MVSYQQLISFQGLKLVSGANLKKAAEKRVNVELHLNLLRFEKLPN